MNLADQTILVTGANGFIGSQLVARLAAVEGARVRALVRAPSRVPTHTAPHPRVEYVYGALTDYAALARAARGCTAVIHTAAQQAGNPLAARAQFYAANVSGTENLVRALAEHGGARFIHLSTINAHGLPPLPKTHADSPLRYSGDRYSDSKIDGEHAAWRVARECKIPLTVIRPGCTFGPRGAAWTLLPLERIRRGVPTLIGAGRGICNAVYIDNLVDLIVAALTNDDAVGQAFIGTDGRGVEWREFFGQYARLCGAKLRAVPAFPARMLGAASALYERVTGRPGPIAKTSVAFYTHRVTFDVAKNARVLGHTPRISFEEGMARTEDWLRAEKLI